MGALYGIVCTPLDTSDCTCVWTEHRSALDLKAEVDETGRPTKTFPQEMLNTIAGGERMVGPVKGEDAIKQKPGFGIVLNSNKLLIPFIIRYEKGDDSSVKRVAAFEFTKEHDSGDNALKDRVMSREAGGVFFVLLRAYMNCIKIFGHKQINGWGVRYFEEQWARMKKGFGSDRDQTEAGQATRRITQFIINNTCREFNSELFVKEELFKKHRGDMDMVFEANVWKTCIDEAYPGITILRARKTFCKEPTCGLPWTPRARQCTCGGAEKTDSINAYKVLGIRWATEEE